MKMKKLMTLTLTVALLLAATGCSGMAPQEATEAQDGPVEIAEPQEGTPTPGDAEKPVQAPEKPAEGGETDTQDGGDNTQGNTNTTQGGNGGSQGGNAQGGSSTQSNKGNTGNGGSAQDNTGSSTGSGSANQGSSSGSSQGNTGNGGSAQDNTGSSTGNTDSGVIGGSHTLTPKPQPQPTPQQPVHVHTWVPVYEEVEVTEMQERTYCSGCNQDITGWSPEEYEAHANEHMNAGVNSGHYSTGVSVVVGTENQIVGYKCSECGEWR